MSDSERFILSTNILDLYNIDSKEIVTVKFKLNYQVKGSGIDYSVNISHCSRRVGSMVQVLANKLTDEQYHELCHQLHGVKMEFDGVDGECSVGDTLKEKKYYTVSSSLYRGIFWSTLQELDELDEEAEEGSESED